MTDPLLTLIDRQAGQLEQLEQLLSAEKRALISLDVDALEPLAHEKDTLLQAINELDGEIGRQPDSARLQSDLLDNKTAIEQALERCRQRNQANGQIIDQALNRNRQLIDVLARLRSQNSFTYNNKGRVQGGSLLKKGISV